MSWDFSPQWNCLDNLPQQDYMSNPYSLVNHYAKMMNQGPQDLSPYQPNFRRTMPMGRNPLMPNRAIMENTRLMGPRSREANLWIQRQRTMVQPPLWESSVNQPDSFAEDLTFDWTHEHSSHYQAFDDGQQNYIQHPADGNKQYHQNQYQPQAFGDSFHEDQNSQNYYQDPNFPGDYFHQDPNPDHFEEDIPHQMGHPGPSNFQDHRPDFMLYKNQIQTLSHNLKRPQHQLDQPRWQVGTEKQSKMIQGPVRRKHKKKHKKAAAVPYKRTGPVVSGFLKLMVSLKQIGGTLQSLVVDWKPQGVEVAAICLAVYDSDALTNIIWIKKPGNHVFMLFGKTGIKMEAYGLNQVANKTDAFYVSVSGLANIKVAKPDESDQPVALALQKRTCDRNLLDALVMEDSFTVSEENTFSTFYKLNIVNTEDYIQLEDGLIFDASLKGESRKRKRSEQSPEKTQIEKVDTKPVSGTNGTSSSGKKETELSSKLNPTECAGTSRKPSVESRQPSTDFFTNSSQATVSKCSTSETNNVLGQGVSEAQPGSEVKPLKRELDDTMESPHDISSFLILDSTLNQSCVGEETGTRTGTQTKSDVPSVLDPHSRDENEPPAKRLKGNKEKPSIFDRLIMKAKQMFGDSKATFGTPSDNASSFGDSNNSNSNASSSTKSKPDLERSCNIEAGCESSKNKLSVSCVFGKSKSSPKKIDDAVADAAHEYLMLMRFQQSGKMYFIRSSLRKNGFEIPFSLVPSAKYESRVFTLEVANTNKSIYTIRGVSNYLVFTTQITLDQLHGVQELAETFIFSNHPKYHHLNHFYRNKPDAYWDDIDKNHDGVMKPYIKDYNGDQASPINGKIKGLFFSASVNYANGKIPHNSCFGEKRLYIPGNLFFSKDMCLYFTDFYCTTGSGKGPHYVTLVMARKGTEIDDFCRARLILLNPFNNPFLYKQKLKNGWQVFTCTTLNILHVEVFYTEEIDIKTLLNKHKNEVSFEYVEIFGRGYSSLRGIPKNTRCPTCNFLNRFPIGF